MVIIRQTLPYETSSLQPHAPRRKAEAPTTWTKAASSAPPVGTYHQCCLGQLPTGYARGQHASPRPPLAGDPHSGLQEQEHYSFTDSKARPTAADMLALPGAARMQAAMKGGRSRDNAAATPQVLHHKKPRATPLVIRTDLEHLPHGCESPAAACNTDGL